MRLFLFVIIFAETRCYERYFSVSLIKKTIKNTMVGCPIIIIIVDYDKFYT